MPDPRFIQSTRPRTAALCASIALLTAVKAQTVADPSLVEPTLHARQVRGELLVKWQDGPESAAAARGNARIGVEVKRDFKEIGWQHVQLPAGISPEDGIAAYRALGTVVAVEPNRALQPIVPPFEPTVPSGPEDGGGMVLDEGNTPTSRSGLYLQSPSTGTIPNDPRFASQWNLKKIGMPDAWVVTTGSTNVVVAILDTGVDYKHPDLVANMWRNLGETGLDAQGRDKATNRIDDDGDGYIDDVFGIDAQHHTGNPMDAGFTGADVPTPSYHGTNCAGIIGATGNDGLGVTGINWVVKIMAIAVNAGSQNATTYQTSFAASLEGFDYVLARKKEGVDVRAINVSSVLPFDSVAARDALRIAGEMGILTVCSAGNTSSDLDPFSILLPAAFDEPSVISVAASESSDLIDPDSTFGQTTVDLAAPTGVYTTSQGGQYVSDFPGTSAAAPHVAGAVALLAAARPDATAWEIKAALLQGVDRLPAFKGKTVTGGRLNVAGALRALTNASLPAVVIGSSPAGSLGTGDAPIEMRFSRTMNRASVESAFQLTPAVAGAFEWAEADRVVRFRHAEPFDRAKTYTARILGTARDGSGQTLDGNFDRESQGSPVDDFSWKFSFALTNDDFSQAQALTGATGTLAVGNPKQIPKLDPAEPPIAGYPDVFAVWYRWTAEASGWTTFDVSRGNRFDTLLGVFVGDHLDQLTSVIGTDNLGSRNGSRVSFPAQAGTTYAVAIGAKNLDFIPGAAAGSFFFILDWYPTPPPGLTGSEFSPARGAYGTKITLTGTNLTGATEVLFTGASGHPDRWAPIATNTNASFADLRLTVTVPTEAMSGPILVRASQGEVVSAAGFEVLPPAIAIHAPAGGEAEITWPLPVVPGFGVPHLVLESAGTLGANSWSPVLPEPDYWSGRWRFNPGAQSGPRFYRLKTN